MVKKQKYRLMVLMAVSLLISLYGKAQTKNVSTSPSYLRVYPYRGSVGIGSSFYSGDLNTSFFSSPGYATSVGFRYTFMDRVSFRPVFSFFRLQSEDKNPQRNLSFRSDNVSLSLGCSYDLIKEHTSNGSYNVVVPYIMAGVGGIFFNPKAVYNNTWIELQPLSTEGKTYSRFAFSGFVGCGLRFVLSAHSAIELEWQYVRTNTDYLDDVSGTYIENSSLLGPAALLADRTAEGGFVPDQTIDGVHWTAGAKRGSDHRKDGYSFIMVKFEFDIVRKNALLKTN